jgi:hypothetical protein
MFSRGRSRFLIFSETVTRELQSHYGLTNKRITITLWSDERCRDDGLGVHALYFSKGRTSRGYCVMVLWFDDFFDLQPRTDP